MICPLPISSCNHSILQLARKEEIDLAIHNYSTGSLEKQAPNRSRKVFTKVLNKGTSSITARVRVFKLNGTKELIQSISLTVPPKSSRFVNTLLGTHIKQFEVQIQVNGQNVTLGN
ncbi:hypothetical protein ACQCN2_03040 [Brevibacillus ginsengisoli]|uniref:hypothetical protein n=1 Tax=Brevibacillus ginsengisoli TaxID=363854 RepID=UPI003CF16FFA